MSKNGERKVIKFKKKKNTTEGIKNEIIRIKVAQDQINSNISEEMENSEEITKKKNY